ncbi:MAG: redox-regulated ATPase YchF [Nitrososphaeraceae archaeon]
MLIGIIGKANVGKSTFFNAATDQTVTSANYPFTTIEPNIGIAYVREKCVCREFGVQDNPVHSMCIDGNRFIPVKIIDVAGLVPGAHLGKGLGNKFLDDARQADALIHVVDASGSTDPEGKPIGQKTGDPLYDIKFVNNEFDNWFFSIISKDWDKISKDMNNQKQKLESILIKKLSGLSVFQEHIINILDENDLRYKKPEEWTKNDLLEFSRKIRIKSKPFIIAANKADIKTSEENITKMKQMNLIAIPCASEAELALKKGVKKGLWYYLPGDCDFSVKDKLNLTQEQQKGLEIIRSILKKYKSTGIQNAINTICFDILNHIIVFPVEDEIKLTDKKGNVLPTAVLLPRRSTAKDLARTIHEDLEKGFMYAIDVRKKQRIGNEHQLNHKDVIKIVSTMSRK